MLFNLKTICCSAELEIVSGAEIPYICSECKEKILHRSQIVTPCCNAAPYVVKGEDAWKCSRCESSWDFLGMLLFMDFDWSFKEGVNSAL